MRKKKNVRKKIKTSRKNFLPTLVVTILLWLTLIFIVLYVNPYGFFSIPLFFTIVFSALLFTLAIIFGNTKRGLIYTTALIVYLFLRYVEIGHVINFLLIMGVAVSVDILLHH